MMMTVVLNDDNGDDDARGHWVRILIIRLRTFFKNSL